VISAGEALPPDLARRWVPHVRLFNAYGPTEASVCATMHEVTAADTHRERIPVGVPLRNVDVFVLDAQGQAPILGAAGEVVLGGIGVALGYVGASQADTLRFTSDGRFRTGDQGRWLDDGRLEILGRLDEQVKLGGQRVELAEVEHAVMAHPDVRAAAACVRHDVGPTPLLVAYVVLRTPEGPQGPSQGLEARLRAHARRKLPSYMVPARIMVLPMLPTQESGKVDRRALPKPSLQPEGPMEAVRSMSPRELVIASIVGVLTGRSGITVHDNFFELGGDSITSLQLVARAREQGLLLHAKQIFEHQTVGRIAEVCELAANAPEPSVAKDTGGGAAEYVPTPLQAGMIFESLYAEGAPVYVSQLSVRITGPLDPAQLEQAFNAVIARHSALRACFRMGSSGPVASTVSTVRVPFRVLSAPPAEGVEHFAARDRATPFDLAVAPLMRITLICTGRDVHELVWTHHHLCMDGWSVGLVLQEVAALVASVQPPELPPALPFEAYAAFVAAQPFAPAERFFGAMLRDVEHKTPLGLPERHGPMGPMQRSAECSLRLTTEATLALQSLCRKEHVTLNTVVTLAYAEVLARYAGTDDVVFGITMAGRPPELPNVDSAVGLFINTLPLRLRRDVGRSALRDLSDLQLVLANLRELAHTPLPKVRALSGIPKGELFDSILVFENFPVAAGPVGTGGLHLSELRGAEQTNYPLTVVAAPGPELELRIAYDQDRFDAWDVRTLLERLGRLLTAMVQTPQAPLRNAAITTPDERQAAGLALLGPPPKQPLVPFADRFLHAARAHEHAVAVTDLETQDALSYGDLARRAFALGLLIKRLGGGPEQPVMVCADRGVPLLVALLGAALAGAPFVLLDAMFPLDRLRFQCADAGARIVLCSPACEGLGRAIAQDGAQVVVVPRAQSTGALPPLSAAESAARPGSAAYILYTSGSTGRPKGVVALQEGLGNYLAWAQEAYEVTAGTKALVHTSVAFDLTITTLLLPLVAGAQVVLAPHGEGIDPLVRGIQRGRPELLKLTPSHARLLAAELDGSRQAIAPHVVIGGEALTGDTVAALWRIDDDCTIYNEYGPTETVVGCVVHKVPKGTSGNVPIGLPIAGTRLDIRDAHGRSVEPGIEGELYIGGHGVCREYIGRPDETARAFLVAPGGFRWYRSGDWVRQRRDTSLEYLGRRDEQIKLHGHRIELGELESLVLRAPGVQQVAAVRVSSATEGQEHLAVFVVPSHPSLGTEIVQRQLREDLPHAFLPKQILIVDALPLTTNGKVDRSALAAQALAEFRAAGSQATPRDASSWTLPEQTLSRIWQAVTGATVNSLDDDFFALGGDSIQSLQIIARAAQEGLRLTPRSIFEHPTLRAMAQAATPLGAPGGPQHDEGSIPVSPIQAWFLAQGRAQPSHYNQSVLLGTRVTVDVESLRPLVADVLSIHGLTRTRFVHGPEGWRMVRAPRGTDDELRARHDCVSVVDLRAAADQAQALVGSCDEVQRSFDIVRGPLAHVRMMLTREPDGTPSTRLLLCAHHLVMDAVSRRALLYALEGAIARRSVVPPRASFMDHVRQLQAFATTDSAARREALQYYDHLARQAPSLPATDGPEPHPFGTSDAARTHRTTVASALLGVPGPQVQPRLLTALAGALAAWTRSETNLVDVEGHGREPLPGADLDLSETVGWFTSLYPVPLTFVASHPPEQNLLATVRALEEAPLGGVAFGALAYMCPDKDLTARITGLRASVSFNFLGRLDTAVSADGPFAGLSDGRGAEEAPFEPRSHALEVNAFQLGADLVVEWTYAPTRFTEQAVRELHDTFAAELQRLADAVISAPAAAAANARRAPRRRDDDLVIALKPDGTRPKVVLVHPVGGLVGCYAELSRALPKDIPLYGIQAVGADGAEAPLDSVTAMAARYLRAIESTFGDEPIILGGWSMGAMIAMAMAAQRHPGVVLRGPLVALDQTPGEVRRELSDAALLVEIVGDAIPLDANDLAALTPREQVRTVLAEAKARKLPIAGLDEDDVLRHIELCRTNFRALSSFVPKPITQDILLLRAADRPSWEPQDTDPVAEWRALAQGQVVVHTVPGDHVTMMRPPQVATLALLLATLIE
jgi:amino acid adenylation domain-containing protein/non-ribosomal peptide synthase protein (TIGR01720 family)